MAIHALVVVGRVDASRDLMLGEGCGIAVAGLVLNRTDHLGLGTAVFQSDSVRKLHQRGECGRGVQIRLCASEVVEEIRVSGRESGIHEAVDALEFFHRPPRHADALAAEQFDHFGEMVVAVFAMLAAPDRTVLGGPQVQHPLDFRRGFGGGPVFVKHIDHLRIPRGSEAVVVVAIPISLDEEDMVVAVRTDGIGDASVKRAQECAAGKVPGGLVDQIISGDPRLVLVTFGNPLPEAHGLVLVRHAVPKRGTGVIVIADRIVALTSGCGMQIDDGIDTRRRAP